MHAGKDASHLLLVLAAALLCCGCFSTPDRRTVAQGDNRARPRPATQPDPSADVPVGAARPLRIADQPASPLTTRPTSLAQAPAGTAERPPVPAVPATAPPDGLPDLPSPGAPAPAVAESKLRRLHRLAAEEYARMDGYILRLTRREQVNGKDQPKEIIRVQFRKEPWSVHFVWIEGDAKGREVVYVKGRYDNKLHTRLGPNDGNLVMRPGSRVALAPDSPMVRNSSRHNITEAGVGSLIERFGALVEANAKGDKRWGTLTYLGPQKRPEFDVPVEAAEQVIPPGADKDLPRGGRRLWMFDAAKNHLPALIVTTDDRGHEVEYYLHDRYIYPVQLDDKDFDPDALWGKQ
jgi:hypothetical protein